MPRSPTSGIPGVTIDDIWAKRNTPIEQQPYVKRWWVRARDPNTGRQVSKSFADNRKADAKEWGTKQRARFVSGMETAEAARLDVIGAEYARELRARGRNEGHVRCIEQVVARLVAVGAKDMKSPTFSPRVKDCRAQEAMHLRWDGIDWTSNMIAVRLDPEYALKRSKERVVPLQPELRAILLQDRKSEGYIVADKKERNPSAKAAWTAFRRYVGRCGLDVGRRSQHSTRHSWISLMLATDINAMQVMAWAGHEALVTTEGYSKAQSAYRPGVATWTKGEFQLRPRGTTTAEPDAPITGLA